jgi:rod shape-determining protein MreC
VKPGDLLVSSGLDGIFPAGYPVATVTKVERNPAETFALVEAKPLAQLDRDREVLLLWAEPPPNTVPAGPADAPAATKPAATPSAQRPANAASSPRPAATAPAPAQARPTEGQPATPAAEPAPEQTSPEQPPPQPEQQPE